MNTGLLAMHSLNSAWKYLNTHKLMTKIQKKKDLHLTFSVSDG